MQGQSCAPPKLEGTELNRMLTCESLKYIKSNVLFPGTFPKIVTYH